jgi:hypothetical protein
MGESAVSARFRSRNLAFIEGYVLPCFDDPDDFATILNKWRSFKLLIGHAGRAARANQKSVISE